MLTKFMIAILLTDLSWGASIHWSIDWENSANLYGAYASKNLISRLGKLDGIVKQRVTELEEEIDLNFAIFMAITYIYDGDCSRHDTACLLRRLQTKR